MNSIIREAFGYFTICRSTINDYRFEKSVVTAVVRFYTVRDALDTSEPGKNRNTFIYVVYVGIPYSLLKILYLVFCVEGEIIMLRWVNTRSYDVLKLALTHYDGTNLFR